MTDLRDEFIRSYKRGNVEMWKAAAIIAIKVHVGGRGRRWEATDANGKMSADGFATWINGEGPDLINGETVRRYWHAWQRAAAKGIVPDSGGLEPDDDPDDLHDADKADEFVSIEEVAKEHRFLDYYEKSKTAAKEDETAPPLPDPPAPEELDDGRPKGLHEDLDWRLGYIEHGITTTLTWDRWEEFQAGVTDHMRQAYVARVEEAKLTLARIAATMELKP